MNTETNVDESDHPKKSKTAALDDLDANGLGTENNSDYERKLLSGALRKMT